MTIRRTFQGAWAISDIVNGYYQEMQYFDYTKAEAVARFKAWKKEQENEI